MEIFPHKCKNALLEQFVGRNRINNLFEEKVDDDGDCENQKQKANLFVTTALTCGDKRKVLPHI